MNKNTIWNLSNKKFFVQQAKDVNYLMNSSPD